MARTLRLDLDVPLAARDKGDLAGCMVLGGLTVGGLWWLYGRFLCVEWGAPPAVALQCLNPLLVLQTAPRLVGLSAVLVLAAVLWLIRVRRVPTAVVRSLRGLAGFGLAFVLIYGPAVVFDWTFAAGPGQAVVSGRHLYVERPRAALPEAWRRWLPPHDAYTAFGLGLRVPLPRPPQATVPAGPAVWRPDRLGAEGRPFTLRVLDVCALGLGLMGFLSGFWNVSLRPR
ncbi:MAG: hypothetical protein KatS3mg121_1176 [Gammaproteobacteria bacterium]|nr:MAG: hypothetical protein KatS3mg121_1176 [Gammaproteobacteria bacterium]